MAKRKHSSQRNLLTSPGTLTYVGPEITLNTVITRIRYSPKYYERDKITKSEELAPGEDAKSDGVTWYNVDGIHNALVIGQLGKRFGIHPLVLEDVIDTHQKPKLETYEDHSLFLVLKMLRLAATPEGEFALSETPSVTAGHISLIYKNNLLLSFQEESEGNVFKPVEDRLKASVGKTRSNGADYLLFALLDVVVDNYFIVLGQLEERIERVEDDIINNTRAYKLKELYAIKRDLTLMRRCVWPLRDMVTEITRDNNNQINPHVIPYFRDLYDHIMQVIESIESHRELLANLVDVHLSTMSNRMNEVMKTLTIFSAIFMPLTFIVGVYGMNFENMPELSFPYGYYATWGVMLLTAAGLYGYFKWKKWM